MTEPTKPALTVEQEAFEQFANALGLSLELCKLSSCKEPHPHYWQVRTIACWTAWQASRRQRDKEFIDMLKTEADNDPRYAIALYAISDELEAELKAETGQ